MKLFQLLTNKPQRLTNPEEEEDSASPDQNTAVNRWSFQYSSVISRFEVHSRSLKWRLLIVSHVVLHYKSLITADVKPWIPVQAVKRTSTVLVAEIHCSIFTVWSLEKFGIEPGTEDNKWKVFVWAPSLCSTFSINYSLTLRSYSLRTVWKTLIRWAQTHHLWFPSAPTSCASPEENNQVQSRPEPQSGSIYVLRTGFISTEEENRTPKTTTTAKCSFHVVWVLRWRTGFFISVMLEWCFRHRPTDGETDWTHTQVSRFPLEQHQKHSSFFWQDTEPTGQKFYEQNQQNLWTRTPNCRIKQKLELPEQNG